MGKAAKFKQLRRLANQLPPLYKQQAFGERVLGSELDKSIKEIEGKEVDPEKVYRKVGHKQVTINHNRLMKKIYNKRGITGVGGYANAVINFSRTK